LPASPPARRRQQWVSSAGVRLRGFERTVDPAHPAVTGASAFLDGVNVATLALMAVVPWQLGRSALLDWITSLLAVGAAILLFRWRVNPAWLVLGGFASGC